MTQLYTRNTLWSGLSSSYVEHCCVALLYFFSYWEQSFCVWGYLIAEGKYQRRRRNTTELYCFKLKNFLNPIPVNWNKIEALLSKTRKHLHPIAVSYQTAIILIMDSLLAANARAARICSCCNCGKSSNISALVIPEANHCKISAA